MNFIDRVKQLLDYNKQEQYKKQGIVTPLPTVSNPQVPTIKNEPSLVRGFQQTATDFGNAVISKFPDWLQPQQVKTTFTDKLKQFQLPTTPKPTPTPTGPTPTPLPLRIAIPSADNEGETIVPSPYDKAIYEAFDPYGEATNAATVLHHPMQISGTPMEIKGGTNWWGNRGENPSFNPLAVNQNKNGSLDTGLFQINSDTFNGMMENPYWRAALERRGITNYSQMTDPFKNSLAAMLILMRGNFNQEKGTMNPNPSYVQWYGAPQNLRNR